MTKLPLAATIALAICGCSGPRLTRAEASGSDNSAIPVATAIVERVTAEETVPILGTVATGDRATVASEVGGKVAKLLVPEGAPVIAGQPIIQLDAAESGLRVAIAEGTLERQLAEALAEKNASSARFEKFLLEWKQSKERLTSEANQAEARVAEARARLQLLLNGARPQELERAKADVEGAALIVEAAKQTKDFAEKNLARKRELFAKGFIPLNHVDEAQYQFDRSSTALLLAEGEHRAKSTHYKLLQEGALKEELEQSRAQLRNAEAGLRAARTNLGLVEQKREDMEVARAERDRASKNFAAIQGRTMASEAAADLADASRLAALTTLKTPISGTLASIKVKPGDVVEAGQSIADVSGSGFMRLEATALGEDATRIEVGARMKGRIRALGDSQIEGVVRRVIPPAGGEAMSFRIIVEIPARRGLSNGMVVSGDVVIAKLNGALLVPSQAIFERISDSEAVVFTVDGSTARKATIRFATASGARLRILEGLKDGDIVVVEGQALLKDGSMVRLDGGASP